MDVDEDLDKLVPDTTIVQRQQTLSKKTLTTMEKAMLAMTMTTTTTFLISMTTVQETFCSGPVCPQDHDQDGCGDSGSENQGWARY